MGALGSCYGFGVRSSLPLTYLRDGDGEPLDVVPGEVAAGPDDELLQDWRPPAVPFHASLYGDGTTYRLWVADTGWLGIDPHASRIVVPAEGDPLRIEERLWGMPALLCFIARGDVPVHAAAVEINGQAVVLAAPGRFGKTTLLSALAGEGLRVLTEDLACMRATSDGAWLVPGPAMLRLRRDVADRVLPTRFREVGRDDERVHLADGADRGDCSPVPVSALVLLRDDDGPPRLASMDAVAALADLWKVSFRLPRDADRARCFGGLADLVGVVPLFELRRRLSLDDLPATVAVLRELVR
jgi:hypothetical protein